MDKPLFLTVSEAAAILRMGRSYVYQEILSGALPSVKLGRARRIPAVELERYVEKLIQQGAAA